MKQLFLGLIALFTVVNLAIAQDGKDALKTAEKSLAAYNLSGDDAKLMEAVKAVPAAVAGSETKLDVDTYLAAGEVMVAAANSYITAKSVAEDGSKTMAMASEPAVKAAEYYQKAFDMAEKKGDKKKAVAGLQAVENHLSNAGILAIQNQQYDMAYHNFVTGQKVYATLKANGEESLLNDDNKRMDESYYAALAALLNNDFDNAKPLLVQLKSDDYDDSGLYDGLYKVTMAEGDTTKAYEYLTAGREKYPTETSLLFTEINHFLAIKQLDKLTAKLEEAIAQEPDNISLYATTGSVYDNLYQREAAAGNTADAQTYFDKARSYYDQALTKNPTYAPAVYSIGALYYNRAAAMTQELSKLGDDFSKEGQKKYDALKTKVDSEFELALPYFIKAEKLDPNDLNTIIALKEMYARKSDYDASNAFKERIEKVQAGEKLTDSYHK
ncbi:MAG: hypothetical protein WBA17_16090 [Saprospiraceae bacterium]